MTRLFVSTCTVILSATFILSSVHADTATFRHGDPDPFTGETYEGTEDTILVVNAGQGETDQNFGARLQLFVGGANDLGTGWPRRSLLRFDTSTLFGQYSQINSVTIRLAVASSPDDGTLQVFQISDANAEWIEGTGNSAGVGDPPDVGMPTWEARIQGATSGESTPWIGSQGLSTPGVDYTSLLGDQSYDASTTGFFDIEVDPELINELVGEWTCGTNAGMLLRVEGPEIDNEIKFHSRDAVDIENRPQLIISYDPAGEIGDINLDGNINLLDVAPFVEAVSSGVYVPAADINQDCSVDLLDVGPFIELLAN